MHRTDACTSDHVKALDHPSRTVHLLDTNKVTLIQLDFKLLEKFQ